MADNKQCSGFAIDNSDYCLSHDPNLSDKRKERAILGGSANGYKTLEQSLTPLSITSPDEAPKIALQIMNEVRSGILPVKVASCLAYLLNTLIKSYEISQIKDRMEIIDSVLVSRKSTQRRTP
jgi:hypothetical protein